MPESSPPAADDGIRTAIAAAFRRNRLPFVMLNVLAVGLVASYYFWPSAAAMWESVARFRVRWSWWFSFASTVLAAALLPALVQWAMGTLPAVRRGQRLLFLTLFWGYRGMEIDLLYRLQEKWFGSGTDAATLALKVAVDQLVYSPVWAVPTYVIALRWIDSGSWARTAASLNRAFLLRTYPAILFTNFLVWIPAVTLIYSLPLPLQFPLFSIVMCFFVLVVTILTRDSGS